MKVILASQSKERRRMFEILGIDFEVCSSNLDESNIKDEDATKLVQKLAEAKAEEIAKRFPDSIIVAGDSLCVFGDKILGKPKDLEEARKNLKELSGKSHFFISGFCIINAKTKEKDIGFSRCEVTFRELTDIEIDDYLKTGEALRLAAGYQTTGARSELFISHVNGSYAVLNGLPMEKIIPILQRYGVFNSKMEKY